MNCTKEHGQELVNKYWEREWEKIKAVSFPDTREKPITAKHMINEFKNLCKKTLSNKAKSDIIHYFHPSIFTANKGGRLSPVEYWKRLQADPELFKKFYLNRLLMSDWFNEKNGQNRKFLENGFVPLFIYSIGCTTSGKAPCVSYFKPAYIKNLIIKYVPDCKQVFDPCTGYSKFLGALAAGKDYLGQDINNITIEESKNCLSFIEKNFPDLKGKVQLTIGDMFNNTGKYEVLLTCPPYSNEKGKQIEEWQSSFGKISCSFTCDEIITKLLQNYECEKYIFIVDNSLKNYREYIKEKFENVNYLKSEQGKLTEASHNYEAVVVITKEERDKILEDLK